MKLKTGPNATDRASTKRHLLTDANCILLALILTGATRNDVTELLPLIKAIPPIRGNVVVPYPSPASCRVIADTTTTSTAGPYTPLASPRRSPAGARRTAAALARPAWLSNERSPG